MHIEEEIFRKISVIWYQYDSSEMKDIGKKNQRSKEEKIVHFRWKWTKKVENNNISMHCCFYFIADKLNDENNFRILSFLEIRKLKFMKMLKGQLSEFQTDIQYNGSFEQ